MEKKRFSLRKRINCFKYAFRGMGNLIRYEHNAWIHTLAVILVVTAGLIFHISTTEWLVIILVCAAILAAEGFNTAIEKLADLISPGYNETIKEVKDIAAGAVLFLAIAAAIIGLIIFIPKIFPV